MCDKVHNHSKTLTCSLALQEEPSLPQQAASGSLTRSAAGFDDFSRGAGGVSAM